MNYDNCRKLYNIGEAFNSIFYMDYPQYRFFFGKIWQPENNRFILKIEISNRYDYNNNLIASASYTEEAFIEEIGGLTGFNITRWLLNKVDDLLNNPKKLDL